MNFKKKHSKKTLWRKEVSPARSINEWSRMLHAWWKKDLLAKIEFKKSRPFEN